MVGIFADRAGKRARDAQQVGSMSDTPRQACHADWLRHFLDLSRQYFGLVAPSFSGAEKPADHTPRPDDSADSSEKDTDEG
ncbi:MAG: hypothetical protein B7Y41_03045 [Hydrogenophilales bacterium 28-61-23]|nr:MAG: hypothetical protein B7Y41_03045 [Hydrogenophilales bacterium 28-61-23]